MGIIVSPSDSAITETSLPKRRSSITIIFPEFPKFFLIIIESIALRASSLLSHTTTPFPAASPSALITKDLFVLYTKSLAFSGSEKILYSGDDILFSFIKCFAKDLLDSNWAASIVGPKTLILSDNSLTIPFVNGSSGPTTTIQLFFIANDFIFEKSFIEKERLLIVPPFPGQ